MLLIPKMLYPWASEASSSSKGIWITLIKLPSEGKCHIPFLRSETMTKNLVVMFWYMSDHVTSLSRRQQRRAHAQKRRAGGTTTRARNVNARDTYPCFLNNPGCNWKPDSSKPNSKNLISENQEELKFWILLKAKTRLQKTDYRIPQNRFQKTGFRKIG